MPDRVLSSTAISAPFLPPDNLPTVPLLDYELGGIALRDPTQGLQVQVWRVYMDGDNVMVDADAAAPSLLFTRAGITEVRLAFDQNMNPCVAFMQDGDMWLWWFDTTVTAQVFTQFDGEQPKVCLDDKRHTQNGASDIIFAYLRDSILYFRAQRDRFTVETELADVTGYTFSKLGMNSVNRLQFAFDPIPVSGP